MSQNLKKTIQINPELFKITGNKTKNNRKKPKSPDKPITPNLLKKQLLERIKSHKQKVETNTKIIDEPAQEDEDEFTLSMNFLSSLSNHEKKTPTTTFADISEQSVHIGLPIELSMNKNNDFTSPQPLEEFNFDEQYINSLSDHSLTDHSLTDHSLTSHSLSDHSLSDHFLSSNSLSDHSLTSNSLSSNSLSNDVPYGCLKNGKKPTYRSWKNNSSSSKPQMVVDTSNLTEREKKLNQLKDKFKKPEEPIYIKRVIKKKYTLGKSKIYKKVGVLIKNVNTRKKIIDSHKDLKSHDISQVKNYLKLRGLIKIGNNTPTDILRKIYESSILTGDVVNNNKDILLHNLLNDRE